MSLFLNIFTVGYSVVSVREGNNAVFPTLVKDIFNCPLLLGKG
jgi:hypothetical protein